MGERNSSRTRVVPVFNALMERDPTGCSWLPTLLKLGSRSAGRVESLLLGPLIPGHERWWGENEKRLVPPKALLRWLIEHLEKPPSESCWGSKDTKEKRELLVGRDPETIAQALRMLDGPLTERAWYVLEGQSQPDVYLETGSLILVLEGKRTERRPTTSTTWMRNRSQMLRHMDAAWEVRQGKKVLGMMIVEGPEGADAMAPSGYWNMEAHFQVLANILVASLPHRTPPERQLFADGFLGVTTWQRVCSEFQLPWPPANGDSPRA